MDSIVSDGTVKIRENGESSSSAVIGDAKQGGGDTCNNDEQEEGLCLCSKCIPIFNFSIKLVVVFST